ncbi:hypothetical protein K437DRAFT_254708 [Tilletiaria anomala UBC 951]|uniref:Uncharacterized protein n=1 Tax=Tilletiaria anomala (strain ATCC 24038 / CBS 436.72 / UBC 951) TaxID=1037660 RepID=A0A066WDH1_TILAU|nr:uncharacterized protein K437DRAFT_254708 [Tilletiaria anomala UBC 951]KDN51972.1 hypothetical protein K437DRAFT_254708 [Tilletiaria anomala UBC 951]
MLSAVTFVVTQGLLRDLLQIYHAVGIVSPGIGMTCAGKVSENMLNLLCNGCGGYSTLFLGFMEKFSELNLDAVLWIVVAFTITMSADDALDGGGGRAGEPQRPPGQSLWRFRHAQQPAQTPHRVRGAFQHPVALCGCCFSGGRQGSTIKLCSRSASHRCLCKWCARRICRGRG